MAKRIVKHADGTESILSEEEFREYEKRQAEGLAGCVSIVTGGAVGWAWGALVYGSAYLALPFIRTSTFDSTGRRLALIGLLLGVLVAAVAGFRFGTRHTGRLWKNLLRLFAALIAIVAVAFLIAWIVGGN